MRGITCVFKLATLTFFALLGASGSLAEEPWQGVVDVRQDSSRVRERSDETSARSVLSPKEIERLLAEIRSRGKGSVLVVDCTGAYGYATIQSAIDVAEDGDIVVVLPYTCEEMGCYYGRINFLGKAITVQSAQPTNPTVVAATIINAYFSSDERGDLVTFDSGEGPDSVLDGLTITGGNLGSGVYCEDSSPTLAHCRIIRNSAYCGAGVFCYRASPTLLSCTIADNEVASATLTTLGGGVYCLNHSNPKLDDCEIRGNRSDVFGGGFACDASCMPTLSNCHISDNEAEYGGGVHTRQSNSTFINCTISGNSATIQGGGFFCDRGAPTLTHCTISANRSLTGGGGLCGAASDPTITNCIFWDNLPRELYFYQDASPIVAYCDVQGGWDGEGNIDADPQFAFADDMHLLRNSPCIDVGTNTPPGDPPSLDADGTPRPLDGNGDGTAVADIGAYEFNAEAPLIALSPRSLEVYAPVDTVGELSPKLSIRNTGGVSLQWRASSDADWLDVQPQQGESTDEVDVITLSIDPLALTPGIQYAEVTVSDDSMPPQCRSARTGVHVYVSRSLHVPAEYATIQAAIDAAHVRGDEVVVADGIYTGSGNKNLDLRGKEVTLRSESGDPTRCIIDCEKYGSGFVFRRGETSATQVLGFMVRNAGGAGMLFDDTSSPTIIRCKLTANGEQYAPAASFGGGVYCSGSASPILRECVISLNSADNGGGVYCDSLANPTFTDCVISDNIADYGAGVRATDFSCLTLKNCIVSNNSGLDGGAMFCDGSCRALLSGCTVLANHAENGAGIYVIEASMTAYNCAIAENIATGHMAGVYCRYGVLSVRGCLIRGNKAAHEGGGVYCDSCELSMADCRITAGQSAQGVGGIALFDCSGARLDNCIIAGNSRTLTRTGISCYYCSDTKITNCTLVNSDYSYDGHCLFLIDSDVTLTNSIVRSNSPQSIDLYHGIPPVVTYCNVAGGWEGEGNIDVEPRFAIGDDYCLAADSPCIDAGTNTPPGGLSDADIDGNNRCVDGDNDSEANVDIGAHEFHAGIPVLVVSSTYLKFLTTEATPSAGRALVIANAGSGGPALQWSLESDAAWLHADAVQGELLPGESQTVTLSVDATGFAPGSYTATLNLDAGPPPVYSRSIDVLFVVGKPLHVPAEYGTIQAAIDATVFLCDEVVVADGVYTGSGNKNLRLHGKTIKVRSASGDPAKCIIDCEGDGSGFSFQDAETRESVVDGFTVRNGSASDGGGVFISSSNLTLSRCCIIENASDSSGGGLYCSRASPVLIDCVIAGNTVTSRGAGLACYFADLVLINCTISDNTSESQGGGLYVVGSNLAMTGCIVSGNSTRYAGGGLRASTLDTNVTVTNCVFSRNIACDGGAARITCGHSIFTNCVFNGNSASELGGGVYFYGIDVTFEGCTIYGNVAGLAGGALFCHGGSPSLTNCILWGDQPREIEGDSSKLTLSHCDIQGGWAGEGANNIAVDPLFIDADGPDELPGTADDDLRLKPTSSCIDAGDPEYVADESVVDLDGSPRVMGCRIDMGAYEFLTGVPGSGDLDGSGTLDVDDIPLFVFGLLNDGNVAACVADMNGDNRIDGRDIQLYAEVLLAQ